MYLPEMADERLAKPRAIAAVAAENFMMMVCCLFEERSVLLVRVV
jgi:hypothetical protein